MTSDSAKESLFTRLNPLRYMFAKIFLWFWLTVIVMVVCGVYVTRQINEQGIITAATDDQVQQFSFAINGLQRGLNRGADIQRLLRRIGVRGRPLLVVVNKDTGAVSLSFPRQLMRDDLQNNAKTKKRLQKLSLSEQPLAIKMDNIEFIGPYSLNGSGQEFGVFAGRLLSRKEIVRPSFAAAFWLIIAVGTLLCLFLAWYISKPIKALRLGVNNLARGDLNYRISTGVERKDEFGELSQEFNSMAARLSESSQQQKQLLANVSHELRTPLTRLQLASAMLDSDSDDVSNTNGDRIHRRKYLQRIEYEIQLMDALIGRVLQLSRLNNQISEGKSVEIFERVSPAEFIGKVIDDLRFEAESKDINLLFNCILDKNYQQCVSLQTMREIIENIARNAIRYAKSRVEIELGPLSSDDTESGYFISVEDDGAGLTKAEFEMLLEPFRYSESGTQSSDKHQSFGLGLAIARAGVELHKGRLLFVQSDKLSGLCLRIELPITRETASC